MIKSLQTRAYALKKETFAVYLAARDPRTPWYAKALAVGVAAYALSPIDLIPDFIPVLGYLDDLILVPAGIALAIRLIPAGVLADARAKASAQGQAGGAGTVAAILILAIWILAIIWAARIILSLLENS